MSSADESESPVVVLGYDDTDAARDAVRYAARRLAAGGRLIVTTGVRPSAAWATAGVGLQGTDPDELEKHRVRAEAVLATLDGIDLGDVALERVPADGSLAEVLLQLADEHSATEIVVPRDAGGRRTLQRVAEGARCPVVVA